MTTQQVSIEPSRQRWRQHVSLLLRGGPGVEDDLGQEYKGVVLAANRQLFQQILTLALDLEALLAFLALDKQKPESLGD